MSKENNQITIIGAGLAGTYLAILLAKKGFKVDIYERTSEKHLINSSSKKSFNITFYAFAVKVLKDAGLWKVINKHLIRLEGAITYIGESSKPVVSKFEKDIPYYTISRVKFLSSLVKFARKQKEITFHFNTSLASIDKKTKMITLIKENNKRSYKIKTTVIIGADGVNSKVRSFLQRQKGAKHSQIYEDWDYKQIKFNKKTVRELKLKRGYTYSWTQKSSLITGYPAKDGSFNAMLILPKTNGTGFDELDNLQKIREFITKNYPSFAPARNIIKDISDNPKGHFVTVHTHPWHYKGFIVLIGDAAHGFPPFYGQGVSAAFGDGLELVDLLNNHNLNWKKIAPIYQELRKKHMDALGELSRETFVLYRRYQKADYTVIYDKFEQILHSILPNVFSSTPSNLIAKDPGKTAYIIAKHQKQRKLFKRLGVPRIIKILTKIVEVKERLFER